MPCVAARQDFGALSSGLRSCTRGAPAGVQVVAWPPSRWPVARNCARAKLERQRHRSLPAARSVTFPLPMRNPTSEGVDPSQEFFPAIASPRRPAAPRRAASLPRTAALPVPARGHGPRLCARAGPAEWPVVPAVRPRFSADVSSRGTGASFIIVLRFWAKTAVKRPLPPPRQPNWRPHTPQ